jgi:hypothetical protein
VEQGFGRRASREAEDLLRTSPQAEESVLALCDYAYATFQFGDFRTANEAIGLSKAALSRIDVVRRPLFVARIRLVEYNLSSVQDDPATAYNTISRLASELTRIPFAGPDEADFKCSVHLAHCHASVLAGNLHQARDAIRSAMRMRVGAEANPPLDSQLAFMQAYAGQGRTSALERLELLMTALQVAQRTGSASNMLAASLGLIDHYVAMMQNTEARRHAQIAYDVAHLMEGAHFAALATDTIAGLLLRTEHWQYAMALLRETPFPSTPYYDLHTALYDAQILLRKGQPLEATRAFLDCKREAYSLGEFRTLAILLPELATAQLQCGMLADAQENIREARPIVQAYGTDSMVRLSQQSTESVLR